MKKILIVALALLGTLTATAQTDVDLDPEWSGRLSATLDKKIQKGLHLTLEEEARMDNNFGSFNRLQTTVGATYKLGIVKLGLGYALIMPYSSSNDEFKSLRHRAMLDARVNLLSVGSWTLSLKERLQFTYRSGDMNEYQNPRTAVTLKSRLKLQYTAMPRLKPYGYLELRTYLNAPVISAQYNSTTGEYLTDEGALTGDPGWFLQGFSGAYFNRVRGCLGAEYRLDRRNYLEAYLLLDHVNDKEVDANAEGTKLKSYTREQGFIGQICISYRYAF